MIERGHKPIVDALSKMSDGGSTNWVRNLPAVLWADRSTVRTSTGLTPYYISCGNEPVLPIELEIPTWRILPWDEVHPTSDLLAMRALANYNAETKTWKKLPFTFSVCALKGKSAMMKSMVFVSKN